MSPDHHRNYPRIFLTLPPDTREQLRVLARRDGPRQESATVARLIREESARLAAEARRLGLGGSGEAAGEVKGNE